MEESNLKFI